MISRGWPNVWRLRAGGPERGGREYRGACQVIETRRKAIAGGQRLLADDPAFDRSPGWGDLEMAAITCCRAGRKAATSGWNGTDRKRRGPIA